MTHLGDFGSPAEDFEEVTFGYFGETIHANPSLSELDYVDFIETAGTVDPETAGPETVGLVKSFARMCIQPDDFEKFWQTAKTHRQGIAEVFKVLQAIVEVVADRPTERSSSSAATPTTDATKSAGVSSAVAARLEGRPDLQLIVERSLEAQAAAAG